jgi:hypothetical protein
MKAGAHFVDAFLFKKKNLNGTEHQTTWQTKNLTELSW